MIPIPEAAADSGLTKVTGRCLTSTVSVRSIAVDEFLASGKIFHELFGKGKVFIESDPFTREEQR